MKKVLFWDFDGTLSYPNKSFNTALYDAVREYNYDINAEKVSVFITQNYSWKMYDICYPGRTGEMWWDSLGEKINIFLSNEGVSKRDFDKINKRFRELLIDVKNYCLYEDTVETLTRAMEYGFRNVLITNNYPEIISNLEKMNIASFFDQYAVSSHIGFEKPRKEFFEYAKQLAGNPEIGYVIGDNPVADIKGGKAAGLVTIAVHECKNSEADYYVENLINIFKILK